MSTSPTAAPSPVHLPPKQKVVVVSHSTLFYWWPVWAVGYVMALITFLEPERMVTVPDGTEFVPDAVGELHYTAGKAITERIDHKDLLVAKKDMAKPAFLHMTSSNNPGVIFAIVLLLVIWITNVPMRGLWSVIAIIVIVLVSVIFALVHYWEKIFTALSFLDIRINAAGYLFISTGLLILWALVFFLFDRQVYMVFTPGNLTVQLAIGDGETTYDTTGMVVQKQRSDLFRHWILGLGSGDLIVNTSGAQAHHFDLPNVLAIGRRVAEIEELMRTKAVVAAPPE
jgi:hypothetical protein